MSSTLTIKNGLKNSGIITSNKMKIGPCQNISNKNGIIESNIDIETVESDLQNSTMTTIGKSKLVSDKIISNANTRFDGDGDWHIETYADVLEGQVYISGKITLELKNENTLNKMKIFANELVIISKKEIRSTNTIKINHYKRICP